MFLLLFAGAGMADTYQRQSGIDVLHYELRVELNDTSDTLTGIALVQVKLLRDGISSMWLDLEDMTVESVRVSGSDQPFEHTEGRLNFDLGRPHRRHEIALIEIRYRGTPGERGMLIGKNRHGRRVFFAENWPDRAHYWFPSIDHPADKATVDFFVTAPDKYDVVANGRLVETRSLLNGFRLTHWSEAVPIPTYCMVIGVAEFSVLRAGRVGTIPLITYAYPEDSAAAAAKFRRTNLVMRYFSDVIGPYPYEKLAQVQSTTRIGGMENSSVIFYSERSFQGETVREGPVPHEIAHQWFGDSITQSDWDHLWLSEGFATYFDALFYEHLEGPEALSSRMSRAAERVKRYHQRRPAAIIDPGLTNLMRKLNAFNYQKGAWVLHMLRKVLGDDAFFEGIRRYYRLYAGGNALSEDFQRVMEVVGGETLEIFFSQWLYQPGWPEYLVSWDWDADAGEIELKIEQVQETGLFDMPVDVALVFGGRQELRSLRVSGTTQTFRIKLPERPSSLEIDPDGWILKSVEIQ